MRYIFSLIIAVALFIFALGFGIKRAVFLMGAERTIGKVQELTSVNSTCGSKHSKHDCTKFSAKVGFTSAKNEQGTVIVAAGQTRGYDQPTSSAKLKIGSSVNVLYDPNNISEALDDSFATLWLVPCCSLFGSVMGFFGAFRNRRR